VTVRVKAAILVVASCAIALISIHFVAHNVLVPSYATLEAQFVSTNIDQTWHALDARRAALDATTHDWASWDDAYDFAATRSADFIESNLVDSTFTTIRVNVLLILDACGVLLYGKAVDIASGQEIAVPSGLLAHLEPGGLLLNRTAAGEDTSGLIGVGSTPMLVSARPILTSEDEGPSRGTFVMATFLDQAMTSEISELTCLDVTVSAIQPSNVASDGPSGTHPDTGKAVITPRGPDRIDGSVEVNDVYGNPVVTLTISRDREIYNEGQRTLTFFLTVLAIGGTVVTVLFLILLDRVLLRRLSRLAAEVQSIGEHPEFLGEVTVSGDDEISFLARSIGDTLRSLKSTHRQVVESRTELEQSNAELRRAKQELTSSANQLRRLTRHIQTMREDERALVANEIHDQVGQGLTALKMDLAAMQRAGARGDAPNPALLQRMADVVGTLAETVRRLSTGLRPSMLEDLGVAEAFEWHLAEFGREKALRTSLRVLGPAGQVEADRALTLYRILQEALLVCTEDPSTSEIAVTLNIEARYALLTVQDNGKADSDSDLASRREMSLSLIRERAEVFGGGVTFDVTPGAGTRIVAQVLL
jgi:sensor domain CHASE-containing protein/signal transduction histidine kinase